jgi:uncharacterized cupin superfamily protein
MAGCVLDVELLSGPEFSVGFFGPVGCDRRTADDRQKIYVVVRGDATFTQADSGCREVKVGDLLHVRAGLEHRFTRANSAFAT